MRFTNRCTLYVDNMADGMQRDARIHGLHTF